MSRFEVYTYTCAQHSFGTFVREVDEKERAVLADTAKALAHRHFANCWVRGCQMVLTQVRLVKDGSDTYDTATAQVKDGER